MKCFAISVSVLHLVDNTKKKTFSFFCRYFQIRLILGIYKLFTPQLCWGIVISGEKMQNTFKMMQEIILGSQFILIFIGICDEKDMRIRVCWKKEIHNDHY